MKSVKINPCNLSGEITIPASKSIAHRAIICAALSKGVCKIKNIDLSEDIKATINAICALGAVCKIIDKTLMINAEKLFSIKDAIIDCGESGSTLRFLIPIVAAGGINTCFIGKGKLPSRPIGIYQECLPKAGVKLDCKNGLPLIVTGDLKPNVFLLPGDVSSQFVTGLLMALPLLDGNSELVLTSSLESQGYVEVTIDVLKSFGINIIRTERGFYIPGNQKYKSIDYLVEGDWSQAAFFVAAATLSKDKNTKITIKGLNKNSFQGDKATFEIFSKFGAKLNFIGNNLIVKPGNRLNAINLNASQVPDLVPIVAFTSMFAKGTTIISGARRLRLKESDRLISSSLGINCLGGDSRVEPDGITVNGKMKIKGGVVEGFNDHRIVMAASITAVRTDGEIIINDAQSINKSYPNFFNDYNKLGGNANVIDIW